MDERGNRQHPIERLMDNEWLLLALGFIVPFVSYFVWGMVDVFTLAPATLP